MSANSPGAENLNLGEQAKAECTDVLDEATLR